MDKDIVAVILSFALYILYVLLPVIPAAVIYKKFPDTKVAVQGPFSGLTLKATGAFAAYVVTVLLGFFLVKNTHELIGGIPTPTWTVKAQVELRDSDGKAVSDQSLYDALDVAINPPIEMVEDRYVVVKLPGSAETGRAKWPNSYITFTVKEFGQHVMQMSSIRAEEVDFFSKVIDLKEPIVIQATASGSFDRADDALVNVLTADSTDEGPPVSTPP